MPTIDLTDWRLTLDGEVARPLALTYDELLALPSRTLLVTLACAGNGRTGLNPPAEGEPFGYGATSTAEWTGVPLRTVLEAAGGLRPAAREVLFAGADGGPNREAGGVAMSFQRSVPVERALSSRAIDAAGHTQPATGEWNRLRMPTRHPGRARNPRRQHDAGTLSRRWMSRRANGNAIRG